MVRSILIRARQLTACEWRDLLRAHLALVTAQFMVWTRPRGRLVSFLGHPSTVSVGSEGRARQLGVAVYRVSSYGPIRFSCLVRAVALMRMLEHEGIRGARLCIGVRPARQKLLAHAWVEYGSLVLGDRPAHVRNFQLLGEVEVLG